MSALITLANEVSSQVAGHLAAAPTADGDGFLDLISSKNTAFQVVLRGVAVTIGILFVVWQGVSSRGAMARIIVAALAAGVFVWAVFNITAIKDRVGNEVDASGPVNGQLVELVHLPPPTPGLRLLGTPDALVA